ncbi:type II toxin-antitoxin system RelE family toxin [Haladaptatus halobius]|jgi:mRNA-degrading endonuclease RelE of RelBE toxin-antitoxin system|uniref:type II toxin-antitoxin system RelE family toxin n=1 Tax=Haladaptatus halobius TaxID=2884875 RepID=UPI001D0BD55D
MTKIRWTDEAVEWLEELDLPVQELIIARLDDVQKQAEELVLPLDESPYDLLRIGGYRVICSWDRDTDVLTVLLVCHQQSFSDVTT